MFEIDGQVKTIIEVYIQYVFFGALPEEFSSFFVVFMFVPCE